MNESIHSGPATAPVPVTRLSELPREIAPPHDGWPALEVLLLEADRAARSGIVTRDAVPERAAATTLSVIGAAPVRSRSVESRRHRRWHRAVGRIRTHRRSAVTVAALGAVLAAVAAGISIDRLLLRSAPPGSTLSASAAASRDAPSSAALVAAYVSDPRYLRERQALLRSMDARLAGLSPQTRAKVLASLATIHRSMREIQQALGREPGNALLQGLLIDSYQDEMRVLTAVQEAGAGGGES